MRYCYFTLLFLVSLLYKTNAQGSYTDQIKKVEEIAEQLEFEGSVMISQRGEILFQKAFGESVKEKGTLNSTATLYNYASMGKMFTGVAIMQLVEKGLLRPDDRLIDILPDYPNRGVSEKITIHQLLTHTSGLKGLYRMSSDQPLSNLEDYLPLFVDRDLEFTPGAKMAYSNAGYIVLGLVIEKLSGTSYFEYVQDNIFEPANMTDIGFEIKKKPEGLAIHYTGWRSPMTDELEIMEYEHNGNAAGGGYASVQSFIRFGVALLNAQLLKPESMELLLKGYSDGRGRGKYGYGFFVNDLPGLKLFGHGGGGPGVNGEFQILGKEGIMISILSNHDPHKATFLKDAITGLFLQGLNLMPAPTLDGNITFELQGYDRAAFVLLQGGFTNGNLFRYPLKYQEGRWITKIKLAAGTHYYRFIVNGQSIPDPNSNDNQRGAGGLMVSKIIVE